MFKVLLSNFKKQKINSIVVMVFVIISAMMMICGITVSQEAKTFYQDKIKSTNGLENECYLEITNNDRLTNYFLENIIKREEVNAYYYLTDFVAKEANGTNDVNVYVYAQNPSEEYDLFKPYSIDESITNPIYLSSIFDINLNYKIGDSYELQISTDKGEVVIPYIVGGFYEDLKAPYNARAKLPNKEYTRLTTNYNLKLDRGVAFSFNEGVDIYKFAASRLTEVRTYAKVHEIFNGIDANDFLGPFNFYSITVIEDSLMSTANILSAILIAFSFIIIIISLAVIWFSITSNIQDDVKTLGIYKSIGYTNTNLRVIILIQYLFIVLIGCILGIIGGALLLPLISNIIGDTVCLVWSTIPNALSIALALIAPLVIISLVVYLITRKLNTVSPVVSMRQGVPSHIYKRNNIPLDKYKGEMNIGLSVKSILNGGKRHFSIGIIVAVMAFLSVFVSMLHYNMNVDMTTIVSLTNVEPCEVRMQASAGVYDEIIAMDEVEKCVTNYFANCLASGYENIQILVKDDYSKSEINNIYQGRYPSNGNEIVLSKLVGDKFNKKIGDYFNLKENGKNTEYLIVGFSQSMKFSYYVELTLDGMRNSDYSINVEHLLAEMYLKDGVDTESFIAKVKGIYPEDDQAFIMNQGNQTDMFVSPALKNGSTIMSIIMIVITVIAVFMLLLFVIKLKIAKEKRNIAINKALGYTNFGLMTQLNFGLALIITIGTIIGGILGALLTNSLMSIVLGGFGIMKINFAINYGIVFGIIAGISVVGYLLALLLTIGIRRISARSLLTD